MKLRHKRPAVILAACVLAPLAMTTSAFAAPTAGPHENDLDNHWGRLVLVDTSDNSYIGIDDDLTGEREGDLYEAESDADFFDVPKLGKSGPLSNLDTGENLKADSTLTGGIDYADGSIIDDEFTFEVAANGAVKASNGRFVGFDDATGRLTTTTTDRFHFAGSAITDGVSLVAQVDSYDPATGVALLSGTATSGFLDEVRVSVGSRFVATQPNGSWVMRVDGLTATDKTVTLSQSVNDVEYDRVTVDLESGDTAPPPVVDTVLTSPTQAQSDAGAIKTGMVHFTGTATPGAHVSILLWTYGGREILAADADQFGEWSGDGFLGDGVYTLGLIQTPKGGDERRSATFPISTLEKSPYTKLSDVRPTADDVVRGDTVAVPLSGRGTSGADVQIYIGPKDADWKPRALCATPAKVAGNGEWSCTGLLTRGADYTLFTYQSKGTDSDMVANAITTGPDLLPAATTHTQNGNDVVFAGKATPNSVVEFYTGPKDQSWSRLLGSARTDAYGHFVTGKTWLSRGTSYTLPAYQTIGVWPLPTSTYSLTTS